MYFINSFFISNMSQSSHILCNKCINMLNYSGNCIFYVMIGDCLNMKKLKSIISIGLCFALMFTLTSCGSPYSGVEFSDYINVAKYKGVTVEPISVKVTTKEVNKEIQSRLEAKKTTKDVKKGTVKDGDTVNIDYVGSINGAKFDGGEASDVDLTIGSGKMIDGFEDGIIGAKVGSTIKVKVTFPENYSSEDLAGKKAVFSITVNSKEVSTIPELDEEFVKENSDVDTVAEYKKLVKKELLAEKKESVEASQRTTIWNEIVSDSEIKKDSDKKEKYPEEQLDKAIEDMKSTYEDYAKQSNMELSEFVESNFGMDEDTFNKQIKELSKIMVKEQLVLYYIADKEDIKVTRKEYKQFIKDTLESYGYTEDSFEEANSGKSYEDVVGKDSIKEAALKDKVQKWIVKNGKEKSTKTTKKSSKKSSK